MTDLEIARKHQRAAPWSKNASLMIWYEQDVLAAIAEARREERAAAEEIISAALVGFADAIRALGEEQA